MKNNTDPRVKILNDIYMRVLGREADESAVKNYLPYIHKSNGIKKITEDLMRSNEFKLKNNKQHNKTNFNSMTGDRTSYINSNVNDIRSSPYSTIFYNIIKNIVLLDNQSYSTEQLENRILTIENSLTHIGRNNLSFTIFPHKEFSFNSDTFNNSLRDVKTFQYWVYYLCICNLWKGLYNKVVATCGTANTINQLLKIKKYDFDTIFTGLSQYILNYLAIRIVGRALSDQEKEKCIIFIKNLDSNLLIDYLYSLIQSTVDSESLSINNNIIKLTKSLGRKPKVLVMIAYLETQNQYFLHRMMTNISKLQEHNPLVDIEFALDNERIGKESTDYTPWSRVKRIRNLMIKKYPIDKYDYLYIIDSDIIDYPLNFPTRAIGLNPNGITAPVALIQNSVVFYDWCGYQKLGATSIYSEYAKYLFDKGSRIRNFQLTPPYVNDNSRLVEIDCVGCTYIVPTVVFNQTYGTLQQELLQVFKLAKVTNHKIQENIVQYEDHPTFTDHYTICAAVRANGNKIYMDRGSVAYHADLPIHGEAWH